MAIINVADKGVQVVQLTVKMIASVAKHNGKDIKVASIVPQMCH